MHKGLCVNAGSNFMVRREAYQAMLQNSSFDIHKEAKRFAGIIKKYVQS